jgi:hypothetical protein
VSLERADCYLIVATKLPGKALLVNGARTGIEWQTKA